MHVEIEVEIHFPYENQNFFSVYMPNPPRKLASNLRQ